MISVPIQKGYRLQIPKKVAEKLGIETGDIVQIMLPVIKSKEQ